MMKTPRHVEIPLEEAQDPFARFLAIAIVVTTLAAAGIEFLHSHDARNANEAGVQAQKLGIQRQGELVRVRDEAQAQVDNFGLSQEQRTRAANAFQARLQPDSGGRAQSLQLEQARWETLANLTETLSKISATGATGPAQDTGFPARLVADKAVASDQLFALQDALVEERTRWQDRLSHYAAILTFFAVAVYLFGLSLTLHTRIRQLLAVVGIGFVAVGAAWALALQLTPPALASSAAADEFAAARHAEMTAYALPGDQGWTSAEQHYTKAINLRPTFAQAYHERAAVRFLLGSPQRGAAFVSVAKLDAIQAGADDELRAYNLGLHTVPVLNNLGFNTYLLGLDQNQSQRFPTSVAYFEQALRLDDSEPLVYYNEALALLAQGQVDRARAAYGQAVAHTVFTDVAKKTLRQYASAEEDLVAGALTDLEFLGRSRPNLNGPIHDMKELIVNGVSRPGKPQSASTLSAKGLTAVFFGSALVWTGNLPGFDSNTDVLSTQWYYQDPSKLGWSALASSSGTVPPTPDASGQGPDAYFVQSRSLAFGNTCLTDGQYRVELYVNGRLSGQAQIEAKFGSMQAAVLPDLGLTLCHPGDWKQVDVVRSFASGFVSSDKSRGIYVFRYQDFGAAARAENASTLSSRIRSATLVAYADRFPGALSFDQNATNSYFLDLTGQNKTIYTYPGGQVLVGAGITSSNEVIVGLVFGPQADWDAKTAYNVFDSMILNG